MDRYEEARERAKKLQENSNGMILRKWLWNIFPELKENEDERVKSCISMILTDANETRFNDFHTTLADCLAWLKKQKPIQNINKEDEEVRQYIVRIMEQRDINVPMVQKALAWLEKHGKSDKIVEKAKTEKQRVLVTESDGSANIYWDTRSLKDAITLLKHGLNYLQEIEVKKQIMPNSRFGGCSECIPTRFDKEKQGKKESNDKNEPKFNVGEWITNSIETVQITGYDIDYGYQVDYKGNLQHRDTDIIEKEYHLWTIADAMDGDVLTCNEEILLFKSYSVQGRISLYCWYNGQTNNFHCKEVNDTSLTTRNKIYPATNEQRDTLFAKMKEAGYEWNAEKKELKKIEQKPSAWGKEDDIMVRDILGWLPAKSRPEYNQRRVEWLKSLKQRIGG